MTRPGPVWPDDLRDVAATDALLDDIAAGRPVDAGEFADPALTTLLVSWRTELDDRAATAMTVEPLDLVTSPAARPVRWARAHRRAAAATAVVVAVAASTGVAAAASGPTGPLGGLHKLFFGDSPATHHVDVRAIQAQQLLDAAGPAINAAARAGSITRSDSERLAATLDRADQLLQQDALAPHSLLNQLDTLRTTLAGIPISTPSPATTDTHGRGQSGGDDHGSGEHQGQTGKDNQSGDNSSGDQSGTGSGSDDGGSQSSDQHSGSSDGNQSGDSRDGSPSGGSGDGSPSGTGDEGSASGDGNTASSGDSSDGDSGQITGSSSGTSSGSDDGSDSSSGDSGSN